MNGRGPQQGRRPQQGGFMGGPMGSPMMGGPRRMRRLIFSFWGVMIVGLFLLSVMGGEGMPVKTDWKALEEMIVAGDVDKIVVVNNKTAHITLTKEAVEKYKQMPAYKGIPDTGKQFTYNVGNPEIFREELQRVADKHGVEVPVPGYEYPTNIWGEIFAFLPYLLLIFFMVMMFRSASRGPAGGGGVMNVGKAKAHLVRTSDS